jgi:predicted nuclease of predicted toxin-antitoxin system
MKLKLDENLGSLAADFFRNSGHDVETVRDEGLAGSKDQYLLSICQSEKRCLITLDLDFSDPRIFNPVDYWGIAVLRLPPHPPGMIY